MGPTRVPVALRRTVLSATALVLVGVSTALALAPGPSTVPWPPALRPPPVSVQVTVRLDRPLRRFAPAQTIGAGLDGHSAGDTAAIYTSSNVREMAAAGLGSLSYRLRTELGVEAWHVDPAGTWSDRAHHDGYWTGSARPTPGLAVSWGYTLPRRGDTVDQANDHGYSRVDDGNAASFWKSDPYLDSHFTGEPDARHPQWIVIDLGRPRPLDALRVAWAVPFATRFAVQRYVGGNGLDFGAGHWQDFPHGRFAGRGATQTLHLSRRAIAARFVRVLMSVSSHSAPAGARDVRDRVGFAVREIYVGYMDGDGRLRDELVHRPAGGQTQIATSSTDSWHTSSGRDASYEQPSFQTVLASGLTRHAPVLVPVPLLYGTPANAVAELRYLRALKVPLRGVELGEEPDGQLVSPEDYGALYVQFARAIHRVFPRLPLGGPGFQTVLPDWTYWANASGDASWIHRFLAYLYAHRMFRRLNFFSFEWYPFDDVCAAPGPQLASQSVLLRGLINSVHGDGVPTRLPLYVTEYGYSSFAGQDEVDMPGALLDADTVGTLLASGAAAAYLYGYEPGVLLRESGACNTWGNLTLIQSDSRGRAQYRLADFWESQMLTHDWTQPGSLQHTLDAVQTNPTDAPGQRLVHAYAVRRPDGRVAILLVNLSPAQRIDASIALQGRFGDRRSAGVLDEWQLSSADYRWRPRGAAGRPALDRPPIHHTLSASPRPLTLPPFSITVVRTAGVLPGLRLSMPPPV